MEDRDFRYKIEHLGDLFVEILEGFGMSIKRQFRGVAITHDIHSTERKRKEVIYQIGARVTEIKKVQPDLFESDEMMTQLFGEYDDVSGALDRLISEREERLDRLRGKIKSVMDTAVDECIDALAPAAA